MKRFLLAILIPAVFWLTLPAVTLAGERGIFLTEEIQIKLGDAFLAEQEYYRAITEYKKFLILFPDSDQADSVLFKIGQAYYQGDEFEPAARTFTLVGQRYPMSKLAPAAGYQSGLCYWRLGRFDEAAAAFNAVATNYPASGDAPRAVLDMAVVHMDRKDPGASRNDLERFLTNYPRDHRAEQARKALAFLGSHQELPHKSPVTAGVLSALLPGAGHIYAGHYGDGLTSFFLNGLFIAGTVVAIRQENYAVAGVVGAIGLPFYIGNIYGAANAATKWNVRVSKELRGSFALTVDSPF